MTKSIFNFEFSKFSIGENNTRPRATFGAGGDGLAKEILVLEGTPLTSRQIASEKYAT